MKSEPGVFLEFLQGAREDRRVGKVKLLFLLISLYPHFLIPVGKIACRS